MKPGNHSCLTKQEQVLNPAKYNSILKDKRGATDLQCISMPLFWEAFFILKGGTPGEVYNQGGLCT